MRQQKNSWKKYRTESNIWRMRYGKKLKSTFISWKQETRRSSILTGKIWQLVQSSTAKAENLENEFTEIAAKVQELDWKEGKRLFSCWVEQEEEQIMSG